MKEETKVIGQVVENAEAIGEVATKAAGSRIGVVVFSALLTGAVGLSAYALKKKHDKRRDEKLAAKTQEAVDNVVTEIKPAEDEDEE